MKRNSYPAHCLTCGEDRPAGHGRITRYRGSWVCDCSPRSAGSSSDSGEPCDAVRDAFLVERGGYRR